MYEFSREMQGNAVYMVLRLQPADEMDSLALGMLLNNRIPGLLPLSKRWEKQGFALYYTVSSLTPMQHCAGLTGDERRMTRFLRSYCQMLAECEEYLLEENGLLLEPEYVFVKAATGEIAVPYLPLLQPQTGKTPKAFLDEVIRMAVRQLPQESALVNLLYRESFQESFSPAALLARLDQLAAPAPAPAPAPAAEPVVEETAAEDDALIAVISAAVSCMMEEGTGFTVRRVRRINAAPAWQKAGREEQIYSHF